MKKLYIFIFAMFMAVSCFEVQAATITWKGTAGDGLWASATNWVGNAVPLSTDAVLLDNSVVSGSYVVTLPGTLVALVKLTITPTSPNNITLILPSSNTLATALNVGDGTASTDDVILDNGAILKNSSGASSGTPVVVNTTANGTLRINNGGRYIHNTARGGTTGWSGQLSTVAGTEHGIFEFDVPLASGTFSPSASGRTYGDLTLTNTNGGTLQYTVSGGSACTINGNLTLNSNSSLVSTMTGALTLKGNLVHNGTLLTIPSSQAATLNGSSAQSISGSNALVAFRALTINNASGITLGTNCSVGGTLTLTSGTITLGAKNLTLSGSISGASSSNYIVTNGAGTLIQSVSGATLFPIGLSSSSDYTPITFSNTNTVRNYLVRVQTVTPSGLTGGIARQWVVNEQTRPGGTNTVFGTMTLAWNASSDGTIFNANPTNKGDAVANITGSNAPYDRLQTNMDISTRSITFAPAVYVNIQDIMANTLYISVVQNDAQLPVELSSFTSNVNGRNVNMNWTTKTEKNSDKFVIEKNTTGANWESIGSVKAAVLSNSPKQYSFSDKNLNAGVYEYRLKMIDNDGSFKYSTVTEASVSLPVNFELSQNYPNPFNPSTKINYNLPSDSRVTLDIYNILGVKVGQLVNQDQSGGYYSIDFSSSSMSKSLTSGVYLYRLTAVDKASGNSFTAIKKMMMLK